MALARALVVSRSALVYRPTVLSLLARQTITRCCPSIPLRYQHALSFKGTKKDTLSQSSTHLAPPSDQPSESELPHFDTLKGIVATSTWKAITKHPFKLTTMSPVQAAVLPLLPQIAQPRDAEPPQEGSPRLPRDLLVRAKTGTGKTLAFLVPAIEARLNAIDAHVKQAITDAGVKSDPYLERQTKRQFTKQHVGTLIISPTRELATQIANEAIKLCHHHDLEVRLFTGGSSKGRQIQEWLKGRCDIVVATPGRMRDLLSSVQAIETAVSRTKLLVLDEADTLLDMGFRDDIEAIKEYLPSTPERQTFLFSATVSRSIQQIALSTLDKNHLLINTVTEDASPVHAHVEQYHTVLPNAGQQIPHLLRLLAHDQLANPGKSKTLVFLPTTKMTILFSSLLRDLSRSVLPAGRATKIYEIHSKRTQSSRTHTSDSFRNDKSGAAVLVTSDVSARGIDYPGVTRVIQVGIPGTTEQYIHRIGRTGRAGTGGRGDLVLLPWEMGFVTYQLTEMPLKPLTVTELTSQVKDLATQYDAEHPDARPHHNHNHPRGPLSSFQTPLTPIVDDMTRSISEVLNRLDEESIRETFTSLLGFYLSRSDELRVDRQAIVQGCKDWSMEACGLTVPPYVSDVFLQKLGVRDRPRRGGMGMGMGGRRSREDKPVWRTGEWTGEPRSRSRRSSGFESRENRSYESNRDGDDSSYRPPRRNNHNWGDKYGQRGSTRTSKPRGGNRRFDDERRRGSYDRDDRDDRWS